MLRAWRPGLLGVVFWLSLAATLVVHLAPAPQEAIFDLPWVVTAALLTAALRLVPRADIALVPAAALLAVVDGSGAGLLVLLVALAGVGLRYPARIGVAMALGVVGTLVLAMVLVYDRDTANAAWQAMGITVFVAFVLALAVSTRQAREAHAAADRLSTELAAANQTLREHAEQARELAATEERTRMAGDLHDSLGHRLTVIKVELENAERYRHRDADLAWAEVRQAKTVAADALDEVRSWVRAMRPPPLEGRRGSAALRALAETFDGVGVGVEVSVDGEERPLDAAHEVVLFRGLQEAMTNALRHSGARRVRARLTFEPDGVSLAVVDDGRGSAGEPRGFGLGALAERVTALGGVFDSGDAPGGGFGVRLRLPA